MICRLGDLRSKAIVNVCDGSCLGWVNDLEMDTCGAKIQALIVYGRPKLWGLLGREDDQIVPWSSIECIGEDTVLVKLPGRPPRRRRKPSRRFWE